MDKWSPHIAIPGSIPNPHTWVSILTAVTLLYGSVFPTFLSNSVWFLLRKTRIYLVTMVSSGAFIFFHVTLDGLDTEYLWPGSPNLSYLSTSLSLWLGVTVQALLAQRYIQTRRYSTASHRLL